MISKMRGILGFMLALGAALPVLAQPHISGNLSGTLGPGSYIVDGNCTVPSGSTLSIAPGTTFWHSGHYVWYVYGQLNAVGVPSDSIFFVRQDTARWGGIRFSAGASAGGNLSYCVIDNCLQTGNVNGGGIYTNGVSITVSHSRITNCTVTGATGSGYGGAGIYANSADILVDYCRIVNNQCPSSTVGGGIYLNDCSAPIVRNSEIAYNGDAGT